MQMMQEAHVEELHPDLALIDGATKMPAYNADEITRQAKAIADQAFQRYDQDGNGSIDKGELKV